MAEGEPEAEYFNFGRARCTISQQKGLRMNEGSGKKKECDKSSYEGVKLWARCEVTRAG